MCRSRCKCPLGRTPGTDTIRSLSRGVMAVGRAHFPGLVRITLHPMRPLAPASTVCRHNRPAPPGKSSQHVENPTNQPICSAPAAGRNIFPDRGISGTSVAFSRVRGANCNQFRADSTAISRCQRLPKTPRLAGCGATSPLFLLAETRTGRSARSAATLGVGAHRVSAARRRTMGTKVSKSTGLGTCRSKPALIAAATSPLEA